MVSPSSPLAVISHISVDAWTLVDFHLPTSPGPPETRTHVAFISRFSPFGFFPLEMAVMVFPSAEILVVSVVFMPPILTVVSQEVGSTCFHVAVAPQNAGYS